MQGYDDSSDGDSSRSGGGPVVAVPAPSTSTGPAAKRRIITRRKSMGSSSHPAVTPSTASSHVDPNADNPISGGEGHVKGGSNVQVVGSQQEADALVRRLRQLERENASLANSLARVCNENASLTNVVANLETRVEELAHEPLKRTSVLHSLFEPEKTGWFGGSKSAAREQLERLSAALQAEFLEYQASHASTNDEVQAILAAMQIANVTAAEVGQIVKEQQQALSAGPYAVDVRIVPHEPDGEDGDSIRALREELQRQQAYVTDTQLQLKRTTDDLQGKCNEVIKLQSDLKDLRERLRTGAAAGGGSAASARLEMELQKAKDEGARLRDELQQLRQTLANEERLHAMVTAEREELQRTLEAERREYDARMAERAGQVADSAPASPAACSRCDTLRVELARARAEAEAAEHELDSVRAELAHASASGDSHSRALQEQLLQAQSRLAEQESLVTQSILRSTYSALEAERDALAREVELARQRIAALEAASAAATSAGLRTWETNPTSPGAAAALSTVDQTQGHIAELELEREQLRGQLQQAQAYAVARDQEAQRLERVVTEDKQRVAFLVKKCASATADLRAAVTARDALAEEADRHQVEVRHLQRQVESAAALQKRYDEVVKEKAQVEARLSSVEQLEEQLVKAKETIAYMELAQSSTINMSQYAEMQAAKEKLEHTMAPMKKRLEEASKEIERLRAVTDAQQMVTGNQQTSVQNIQDQLNAATAAEAKLREKVAALSAEKERLQTLNTSLEAQMTDMQDGIKEMAMQMEGIRTSATAKAEASCQRQLEELRVQLEKANAELARVQATTGQFVSEGLYQNACTERDRLAEENKRKGSEFEKMKSEILIYRQTIADLEAENDEHVKEIEALQDRFQSERTLLSERLSSEQKRAAELATRCDGQQEEIAAKDAKLEQAVATTKELQELNARQRRAFEEKCVAEERLHSQLSVLQATPAPLQGSDEGKPLAARSAPASVAATAAAAAATSPAAGGGVGGEVDAAVAKAMSDKVCRLQCDNDRLSGEMKRMQLRHKSEVDEHQRMLQLLQVQVKSRMPADTRVAYEAEISKSTALYKSNESLLKENEQLRKQLASTSVAVGGAPTNTTAAPSTSLPSNAGDLQAQLLQLQQQMAMQRSSFDEAVSVAVADAEAGQRRIEELEAELQELREAAGERGVPAGLPKPNSMGDGVDGAAGYDEDGAAVLSEGISPRPRKKVKKVKKKRALAEPGAGADPAEDELASGTAPPPPTESADALRSAQLRAQLAESDLLKAQHELDRLHKENVTLHETIATLTTDLAAARQELAREIAAMEVERVDYEKRVEALESQVRGLQQSSAIAARGSTLLTGMETPMNRSFSRQQSVQEAEMQLRSTRDEVDRLKHENRQLKNELAKALATPPAPSPPSPAPAAGGKEVRQLQKSIKQKDAEIKSLAAQLMPTKNKLAEYMAMADRLGLQYPFPPQLEGPTVMRLRALNIQSGNRATSAPMASAAPSMIPAVDSSPAPRPPPGARRAGKPRASGYGGAAGFPGSADAFDDLR